MIKSLFTLASGMKAQQIYLDNISNNLANVNTLEFKRGQVNFQDLLHWRIPRMRIATRPSLCSYRKLKDLGQESVLARSLQGKEAS